MRITDEIDFPEPLITAASAGDSVLFVGAGASMNAPANLPSFSQLATQLAQELGVEEDGCLEPDAFIGRLCDFDVTVRERARAIIAKPDSRPNDTRVHVTSRGTYGYRRVHAELTMAMGVTVSERAVHKLMRLAGIYGLPGPIRTKRLRCLVTAGDLVNRKFRQPRPNELWVTDITQHRTREGWIRSPRRLQPSARRLVDRLQTGQHPRHQRRRPCTQHPATQDARLENARPNPVDSPDDCSGRRFGPPDSCRSDPWRWAGQRDDGEFLVIDADRAREPEEEENESRTRERDLASAN